MSSKLADRGYWVSKHFFWQSLMHYLYNSARFRSLTFFSAVNPAISFGGMLNDRKSEIDAIIPKKYRATTVAYKKSESLSEQLSKAGIQIPFIIKPDVGLKGYKVRYIEGLDEGEHFLAGQEKNESWILQSYISFKKEYSILYYHNPITQDSGVTSLIEKEYPFVTGDGQSTMKDLILNSKNVYIDTQLLLAKWSKELISIPESGQKIILDNIGNYSRGSAFHSLMDQITPKLTAACQQIFKDFEGIHFFRMDLKSDSLEDFMKGDFSVIEINGAKGEPLHIYDKKYSFFSNVKAINKHWKILSTIVVDQRKKGYQFPGNIAGLKALKSIKQVG